MQASPHAREHKKRKKRFVLPWSFEEDGKFFPGQFLARVTGVDTDDSGWVGKILCCDECGAQTQLDGNSRPAGHGWLRVESKDDVPNLRIFRCPTCKAMTGVTRVHAWPPPPYVPVLGAMPVGIYPRYDYKVIIEEARIAAKGDAEISNLTIGTGVLSPSELDKLTLCEDGIGERATAELCEEWDATIWRARNESDMVRGKAALAYLKKRLPMLYVLTNWQPKKKPLGPDAPCLPGIPDQKLNKGLAGRLRKMSHQGIKIYLGLEAETGAELKCDTIIYWAITEPHTSRGKAARAKLGLIIPTLYALTGRYPWDAAKRRCMLGGACDKAFNDYKTFRLRIRARATETRELLQIWDQLLCEYQEAIRLRQKGQAGPFKLSIEEQVAAGILNSYQQKLIEIMDRRDPVEISNGLLWPRIRPRNQRWRPWQDAWKRTVAKDLGIVDSGLAERGNYRERHNTGRRRKLAPWESDELFAHFSKMLNR